MLLPWVHLLRANNFAASALDRPLHGVDYALVGKAEAAIGSSTPLPIDETGTNYWKTVDPLHLTLEVDPNATSGTHEVEAKLVYFFCVSDEFCAPARVPLTIPIEVR